jgi:hypothetical protein
LTPIETADNAVQTIWARARVLDLEHQFAAGHRNPGLSDAITAFSLKYGVLCRFTAFVAVDRAEVVNPGGEIHHVVQPVELPSQWAMPMMAGVAYAPPPPASMMARVASVLRETTARHFSSSASNLDVLDIPAFLRRSAGEELDRPNALYRLSANKTIEEQMQDFVDVSPPPPKPLPPWFERLATLANAPVLDTVELVVAIKEALIVLEAIGKSVAKLVKEGREVIRLLEEGSVDAPIWFKTWLARVKDALERKAGGKQRGAWWK